MGRQLFEAEGIELGSRSIENFRNIPGFSIKPQDSYAYFCPKCGEIWGRLRHEGASYTQCIYRPCSEHGDGRLAMAFPAGQPLGIASDWPKAALLRELEVEIQLAEKGN